jgi:hypothetical protein
MHRNNFTTTIAFIPWNYARSSASAGKLFKQGASMLSLCVQGCDHTGVEFGSNDIEALRQKARTAVERMKLQVGEPLISTYSQRREAGRTDGCCDQFLPNASSRTMLYRIPFVSV